MDFVWKLYGNTYAVHVTVALVGVATLNLALPAPPEHIWKKLQRPHWSQDITEYTFKTKGNITDAKFMRLKWSVWSVRMCWIRGVPLCQDLTGNNMVFLRGQRSQNCDTSVFRLTILNKRAYKFKSPWSHPKTKYYQMIQNQIWLNGS